MLDKEKKPLPPNHPFKGATIIVGARRPKKSSPTVIDPDDGLFKLSESEKDRLIEATMARFVVWSKPISSQSARFEKAWPPEEARRLIGEWEQRFGKRWAISDLMDATPAYLYALLIDLYGVIEARKRFEDAGLDAPPSLIETASPERGEP